MPYTTTVVEYCQTDSKEMWIQSQISRMLRVLAIGPTISFDLLPWPSAHTGLPESTRLHCGYTSDIARLAKSPFQM